MSEKKTYIVRLLLIISLLFLASFVEAPDMVADITTSTEIINNDERKLYNEWNYYYENLVDSIKLHERFMSDPYLCPSGKPTVGYGHAIRKTDHFKYPMSEKIADSLLRKDFADAIAYVRKTTSLRHKQLLAMGHFVFCLGSGNFQRSTLKKVIIDDKPIDDELMRWIHIQTSEGKVASTFLLRIRKMELELFKNKT